MYRAPVVSVVALRARPADEKMSPQPSIGGVQSETTFLKQHMIAKRHKMEYIGESHQENKESQRTL